LARPLAAFGAPARAWFEASFPAPTPVQSQGWARIAAGEHALLLAPTGSGKTLAAFFACIDRLSQMPADAAPGVRVLYVSPLKALVYDIERNLRAPLAGVQREAHDRGIEIARWPRVAVRTGDTTPRERRSQARDPAEILVTTPESLYLILGSQQRDTLATVETVIVDEIHALAPTKRGAHLALSLERVAALADREPQRIGLSATARPRGEVARFLGGDRKVAIVDASEAPHVDLEIRVPVDDMTRPDPTPADIPGEAAGLWPAIIPELLEEIRGHRSTIVFTNSRGLCERLARRINDLAGEELARAHHGSVAHEKRREIEEALKTGVLRAIVATSSLELGIDMGAVDLVLLVESPGAVSRGLQRVGRAGHHVGDASRGLIYPKHRGDLLEATVVAQGMRAGDVEPIRIPRNPIDVLAQQLVAMCAAAPVELAVLEALLRRTASYRDLSREALCSVLDMLSGRYPSTDFASLRARIRWDRDADLLEALAGSKLLSLVSGGTIPDRGLYPVHRGEGGPRIGELDEEMVNETRPGEVVTLGASSWRVEAITRDRVLVSPAPGEAGKLPFWRGDGPGRPIELGRALGAFVRELSERCGEKGGGRAQGEAWLRANHALDERAARNLVDYVVLQQEATGTLPTDRALTVERFRDELGDWRVCILSPFGARVHAPWALAIEAQLPVSAAVQTLWSDDGIVLRFADTDAPPSVEALLPGPDEVEERIVAQLADSSLFAAHFRENAARALLLPRRRPGSRTPLWIQRLRAQNLLAVARAFPTFPILLETYRTCLQDVFDVPALRGLLREVREGQVAVDAVETREASPFARSLVFAYTAAFLYQGDTPVAERRAQALTLDRSMLRDLLGQEDLRSLLDADVIRAVASELSGAAPGQRARHADALHDLLRRHGDLTRDELVERCDGDASEWLGVLEATHRAARVTLSGEPRWIAAEDAGLYRDAFGAALPGDLPAAFLAAAEWPLEQVLSRYARHRGPFIISDPAQRYAADPERVEAALRTLRERGRLLEGEFLPGGRGPEWCDPEVLRRLRRRTLAKLRDEVAPVDAVTLARFLPRWHGVGPKRGGEARLRASLESLEAHPLSFSELERIVLPARVPDYDPQLLDALGAHGEWVWIGREALGARDARIALYRRERVGLLADPPRPTAELERRERAVLEHLEVHGASFLHGLAAAAGNPPQSELLELLWKLVVQGLVTNDSFAALRALAARRALRPRKSRRRTSTIASVGAGRWSAVSTLVGEGVPPTRRAHARALTLLERHAVLSRDAIAHEEIEGGFAAVYPVLREMEEAGKLRRGHFVSALRGAQFAMAAIVDQLRATRADRGAGEAVLLGATDPANPFGVQLPWPASRAGDAAPRRAVGASVVIVDGELALYLDRSGRGALTFPPSGSAEPDRLLERAAVALRDLFRQRRRAALRVETIDAEAAPTSRWADAFLRAGFRADYKGLVLERSEASKH
jgi:ATP-dependent Lhr-like helicase